MKPEKRRASAGSVIALCAILLVIVLLFLQLSGVFARFFPFDKKTGSPWNLVLVNDENALPGDWNMQLTELQNGQQVDARIYPELQQMFDDMRADGVYPVVASGYRTAQEQQRLLDEKVEEFVSQGDSPSDALDHALDWVAEVGHSEHQTGLSVDINADGVHSTGQEVYDWLARNAWQYGFILRYPADKTDRTHTDFEPWHYRYVGREDAEKIYRQGCCLEEYLEDSAA